MRLTRRRQPDLFEEPANPQPIPNERRQTMVEILRALLTEALSREDGQPRSGSWRASFRIEAETGGSRRC